MNDRAAYANANAALLPLADKSVHMIATSPPYFGLRSYDTGPNKAAELGAEKIHDCGSWARGDMLELRDDLTDEEVAYVYRELIKAGVLGHGEDGPHDNI